MPRAANVASLGVVVAGERRFLLAIFLAGLAVAQTSNSSPSFEAASVKASAPPGAMRVRGCRGGPGTRDPGMYVCTDATVPIMVMAAFDLKPYQLPGASTDSGSSYEVRATIPKGATEAQVRVMLQNLLTERFGLKYHFEKKEMPVYTLTVGKSGPKLKASPPEAAAAPPDVSEPMPRMRPGPYGIFLPASMPRGSRVSGTTANCTKSLSAGGATTDQIADYLSGELARPVANATGLAGEFDVTLVFASEGGGCNASTSTQPGAASDAPSLPGAVEEQLGLKLEKGSGLVDVFSIDHVEKNPTAN
jgi:uncharacterized protein (TIGR03435 family)